MLSVGKENRAMNRPHQSILVMYDRKDCEQLLRRVSYNKMRKLNPKFLS